jgi:hypothetical protein
MREEGGAGGGGIYHPLQISWEIIFRARHLSFFRQVVLETRSEFRTPGCLENFRDLFGNDRKYQKITWKFYIITQKCIRILYPPLLPPPINPHAHLSPARNFSGSYSCPLVEKVPLRLCRASHPS